MFLCFRILSVKETACTYFNDPSRFDFPFYMLYQRAKVNVTLLLPIFNSKDGCQGFTNLPGGLLEANVQLWRKTEKEKELEK